VRLLRVLLNKATQARCVGKLKRDSSVADSIWVKCDYPDLIQAGSISAQWSVDGTRILKYYVDLRHLTLHLHKTLTATELSILQNKADVLFAQWDKRHVAHVKKQNAAKGKELAQDQTIEAELQRDALRGTLHRTLSIDDAVDWEILKSRAEYELRPFPETYNAASVGSPHPALPKIGFVQRLLGKAKKLQADYDASLAAYNADVSKTEESNVKRKTKWENKRVAWNEGELVKQAEFNRKRDAENTKVDQLRSAWFEGQTEAVEEHASIVLEASRHEDAVPKEWELEYQPDSKIMLVRYRLPAPEALPTVKTVRFVASTGELKETKISEKDRKALFDDICYQICLRTVHELYEADTPNNISGIVFNGWTETIDRATGQKVDPTILSLMAAREEFLAINLEHIEPKSCFKALKGVSASSLIGLAPVAPVMELSTTDKRFVESQTAQLEDDGTTNLAAMNWEEFEHLVRELFEKEFASRGGEVKVTQPSKDGGVDAVAFDPDPISGGKIIIQAKRYTRTVGVNAVRDLYGTTMNEGANKGILVTTADYGPDAHKFAADKPLTLMSGAHLLHLLEKHGIKATIDIKGARKELGLK